MPQAWIAITVATVWWTVGFNTIIFLAALQDIPAELYEAAAIDGANAWQRFRHVTVPMLRPVTVLVITITLIACANLFGQPYLMTAGGPSSAPKRSSIASSSKASTVTRWVARRPCRSCSRRG